MFWLILLSTIIVYFLISNSKKLYYIAKGAFYHPKVGITMADGGEKYKKDKK